MTAAVLKLNKVSVDISGRRILHDISVKICQGRRTVIIGPNGSGKSTLLKTLAGLLPYQQGQALFNGRDINKIARRALARQLAVLPQGNETPSDLTVYELVSYGRFPHRSIFSRSCPDDKKAVEWALERTNLGSYRDRLVKSLSGGERQRAWIAMALAQKPSIFLLDEPTTYLDIAHQLDVLFTVSDLNQTEKLTVVMVLHDINHAVQFADELIIVKDGRIAAQGEPRQVINQPMLTNIFGVKAAEFTLDSGSRAFVPYDLVKS